MISVALGGLLDPLKLLALSQVCSSGEEIALGSKKGFNTLTL